MDDSRSSGHVADSPDTFWIIRTLLRSSGHVADHLDTKALSGFHPLGQPAKTLRICKNLPVISGKHWDIVLMLQLVIPIKVYPKLSLIKFVANPFPHKFNLRKWWWWWFFMMMCESGQLGGNVAIILIGPHITIFATTINVTSFLPRSQDSRKKPKSIVLFRKGMKHEICH